MNLCSKSTCCFHKNIFLKHLYGSDLYNNGIFRLRIMIYLTKKMPLLNEEKPIQGQLWPVFFQVWLKCYLLCESLLDSHNLMWSLPHKKCSVSISLLTHALDQEYSIYGTKSNDGFKIFRKILQNFWVLVLKSISFKSVGFLKPNATLSGPISDKFYSSSDEI